MKVFLTCLAMFICSLSYGEDGSFTNLWFPVGEVLNYKLRWGIIPIGSSHVETAEVDTGGKKLVAIRYYVKTNRFFDKIYPVNDFMEALVDPEGFLPVTYSKKIQRRKPLCEETMIFDRKGGVASWYSACSNKNGSFPIEPETRDIMSHLYFLRKEPLAIGQSISNAVVVTHDPSSMTVKVVKKKKMDVAGIDDVECFQITPVAKLDDLLVEEGEVTAWVSDDTRRVVVRLDIAAAFGTIKARLCSITGPGNDRWVTNVVDCSVAENPEDVEK